MIIALLVLSPVIIVAIWAFYVVYAAGLPERKMLRETFDRWKKNNDVANS